MDPTATFKLITDSLRANNTLAAIDAAIDLGGWLNGGGAFPDVDEGLVGTKQTQESYVWTVLSFLFDLDPDDSLRQDEPDSDHRAVVAHISGLLTASGEQLFVEDGRILDENRLEVRLLVDSGGRTRA